MDGVASLASVGAVVNQTQFQVGHPRGRQLEAATVSADVGSNALKLIQSLVADASAPGRDLDVTG